MANVYIPDEVLASFDFTGQASKSIPALPEVLASDTFQGAPLSGKEKILDGLFVDYDKSFAKTDQDRERLFQAKTKALGQVYNDELVTLIGKSLPEELRTEDNLRYLHGKVIDYHNKTRGLTQDYGADLGGEVEDRERFFQRPSIGRLTEDQVGDYAVDPTGIPELLPSEKLRVDEQRESMLHSDNRVEQALAEVIVERGADKTRLQLQTGRDKAFEGQFAQAFSMIDKLAKLNRKVELSTWNTESGFDDAGQLFSFRRKPDTSGNIWQVRLHTGTGERPVVDVEMDDGADLDTDEGRAKIAENINDAIRANINLYNDRADETVLGMNFGPTRSSLTERERVENLIGRSDKGQPWWTPMGGLEKNIFGLGEDSLIYQTLKPIAQYFEDVGESSQRLAESMLASGAGLVPAVAGAGAAAERMADKHPLLTTLLAPGIGPAAAVLYSGGDDPANEGFSTFFRRLARNVGERQKLIAAAHPTTADVRKSLELSNGWSLDPSVVTDHALGAVDFLLKARVMPGKMFATSLMGDAFAHSFADIYDTEINNGKSEQEALDSATVTAPGVAAVLGSAMYLSGKLMLNDKLAISGMRNWFTRSIANSPAATKGIIAREYAGNIAASLSGDILGNAATMGVARLGEAALFDMATGEDRFGSEFIEPLKGIFGEGGWANFKQSMAGQGLYGDILFSLPFGVMGGAGRAMGSMAERRAPSQGTLIAPRRVFGYGNDQFAILDAPSQRVLVFDSEGNAGRFAEGLDAYRNLLAKFAPDGTKFAPGTPPEVKADIQRLGSEIEAAMQSNVRHRAQQHGSEIGVGFETYDTLNQAIDAAKDLASKFVLGKAEAPSQRKAAFIEGYMDRKAEGAEDWVAVRDEMVRGMTGRGEAATDLQARVLGLERELVELDPASEAFASKSKEYNRLRKQAQGKAQAPSAQEYNKIADSVDALIARRKAAAREQYRTEAEEAANRVFGPEAFEGDTAAAFSEASPELAGAVEQRFVIDRITYTDSRGVERVGYNLKFKEPGGERPAQGRMTDAEYSRMLNEAEPMTREEIGDTKSTEQLRQKAIDKVTELEGRPYRPPAEVPQEPEQPKWSKSYTGRARRGATAIQNPELSAYAERARRGAKAQQLPPKKPSKSEVMGRKASQSTETAPKSAIDQTLADKAAARKTKAAPPKLEEAPAAEIKKKARESIKKQIKSHAKSIPEAAQQVPPQGNVPEGGKTQGREDIRRPVKEQVAGGEKPAASQAPQSETARLRDLAKIEATLPTPNPRVLAGELRGKTPEELAEIARELGISSSKPVDVAIALLQEAMPGKVVKAEGESQSPYEKKLTNEEIIRLSKEAAERDPEGEAALDRAIAEAEAMPDIDFPQDIGGNVSMGETESGEPGFRIKGKKGGKGKAGSTVIFSEIANLAIDGIKAGWNYAKFAAEAAKRWGEEFAAAFKRVWVEVSGSTGKWADDVFEEAIAKAVQSEQQMAEKRKAAGVYSASEARAQFERPRPIGPEPAPHPDVIGRLSPASQSYLNTLATTSPRQMARNAAIASRDAGLVRSGELDNLGKAQLVRTLGTEVVAGDQGISWFDRLAASPQSIINQVSIPVGNALKAMTFRMYGRHGMAHSAEILSPLMNYLGPLKRPKNRAQMREFMKASDGSNPAAMENYLDMHPEAREGWEAWKQERERIYQIAQEAGIDLGYVPDYFPRWVKDYAGFQKAIGRSELNGPITKAWADEAKKIGGEPDAVRKAQIAHQIIQRGRGLRSKLGNIKQRVYDELEEKLLDYYAPPSEALERYVERIWREIGIAEYLGTDAQSLAKRQHISNEVPIAPSSYIGSRIQEGIELFKSSGGKHGISPEGERSIIESIAALLGYGPSPGFIRFINSGIMPLALGNPLNNLGQLQSLGLSLYDNGVLDFARGVANASIPGAKNHLTLQQLGVLEAWQLHSKDTYWKEFTNRVAKYSLFKFFDAAEANVRINSTLAKWQRMSDEARARVIEPFKDFLLDPNGVASVSQKIKDGRWDDHDVAFLAYTDLTDVRPTSLASMPISYLKHPLSRMFYALKTYGFFQLNMLKERSLDAAQNGDPVEAIKATTMLLPLLALGGVSTQAITDWLSGRRRGFDDRVEEALLRVMMASSYQTNQIASGDFSGFVGGELGGGAPLVSFAQNVYRDSRQAWKDIQKGKLDFDTIASGRSITQVPSFSLGQLTHWWVSEKGKERRAELLRESYLSNEAERLIKRHNLINEEKKEDRIKLGLEDEYQALRPFKQISELAYRVVQAHVDADNMQGAIHVMDWLNETATKPDEWGRRWDLIEAEHNALKDAGRIR